MAIRLAFIAFLAISQLNISPVFADASVQSEAPDFFRAADLWYRFEREIGPNEGTYCLLAEEYRPYGKPEEAADESEESPSLPSYGHPRGMKSPTVAQAVAKLNDESSEIRFIASVWLFEENRHWWMEQLEPSLRAQVETKIIDTLREQLEDEDRTVRHEAAAALYRLGTNKALRTLIAVIEDPQVEISTWSLECPIVNEGNASRGRNYFSHRATSYVFRMPGLKEWVLPYLKAMIGEVPLDQKDLDPSLERPDTFPTTNVEDEWKTKTKEELKKKLLGWFDYFREKEVNFVFEFQRDRHSIGSFFSFCVIDSLVDFMGNDASETLMIVLRDRSEKLRVMAAQLLGKRQDRRAVDSLIFALKDDDSIVRATAAGALGRIGEKRAAAAILPLMEDEDICVRAEAIFALCRLGDSAALKLAIEALESDEKDLRFAALRGLGQLPERRAIEAVARVVRTTTSQHVRETAIKILSKRQKELNLSEMLLVLNKGEFLASRYILESLKERNDLRSLLPLCSFVGRKKAERAYTEIKTILHLGKEKIRQPLLDALSGDDPAVRAGAVMALGAMREPRAVEPLIELAGSDDPVVRQRAIWALQELGDRRAVPPLIKELGREFAWSRIDAAIVLGRFGDPRAVEPLCQSLEESDPLLRRAAAVSLGRIGDERAIEPLIAALDDDDADVSIEAARSLAYKGDRRAATAVREKFQRDADPDPRLLPALFAAGWRPTSIEDVVRLLIVFRQPQLLAALTPRSTPHLVKSLKSEAKQVRYHAAKAMILSGDESTIPALVEMYHRNTMEELTQMYVCCGRKELSDSAWRWAVMSRGCLKDLYGMPVWGGGTMETRSRELYPPSYIPIPIDP